MGNKQTIQISKTKHTSNIKKVFLASAIIFSFYSCWNNEPKKDCDPNDPLDEYYIMEYDNHEYIQYHRLSPKWIHLHNCKNKIHDTNGKQ
jgi:hypothetical protein